MSALERIRERWGIQTPPATETAAGDEDELRPDKAKKQQGKSWSGAKRTISFECKAAEWDRLKQYIKQCGHHEPTRILRRLIIEIPQYDLLTLAKEKAREHAAQLDASREAKCDSE